MRQIKRCHKVHLKINPSSSLIFSNCFLWLLFLLSSFSVLQQQYVSEFKFCSHLPLPCIKYECKIIFLYCNMYITRKGCIAYTNSVYGCLFFFLFIKSTVHYFFCSQKVPLFIFLMSRLLL